MKIAIGDISPGRFAAMVVLFVFPLMINLRLFPFVAPNEEPKWAFFLLSGLLIAGAAALALWRRDEALNISLSRSGALLILFLLLLGVGVSVGVNRVEGAIRYAFWLSAGAVWIVAVLAAKREKRWPHLLAWALSIGSFIFSLRYWWSYVLDYGKPGYNVKVLFSPIGHVNFTGDALIILLPALIWLLAVRREPVLKVLNWFSVTTMATVLLVASSRGALAGLAVGLLLLSPYVVREGKGWLASIRSRQRSLAPACWVGSALVASLIVYNLLPYHYRELARLSGTVEAKFESRPLTPGVEQPPLAGFWMALSPWLGDRTPIFASATAMTFDAPWSGHGTGNFAWIYPGYSNRYPDFHDSLSSEKTFTTNPHNIVLQLATQDGIPATLIFLGLLALLLYRLALDLWRRWNGWTAAGLVAVGAAVFDSMFNHVFFNPASMFVFALLAGSWWGKISIDRRAAGSLTLPRALNRPLAGLLVLAAIGLAVWPAKWLVSDWHVGTAMMYIKYPARAAELYERAYAWDRYNFRALFGVAEAAYQQKRYADAVRLLKDFETIYPYNPPALNLLGAAYLMNGQLPEAVAAFERTIKILPSFTMARQNLARAQAMLRSRAQPRSVATPWQSK